jgi:hypothetical protein
MADKVKSENMTNEAWVHELARCRFVTEERNRCRKANKVALNARQEATSAAAYTALSDANGSIPARSGTDLFTAPARSSSPYSQYHATPCQTSRLSPEMGESDTPPSMAEGLFLPVTAPHDGLDLNRSYSLSPAMRPVLLSFSS